MDTRLEDGSRVNVVLSPIALSGSTVTIRKFSKQPMTMEKLLEYGSITPEVAQFLQKLVKARYNIFIAGGTGSGKTTLTNRLKERFGDEVTVIYHDNYYKRHDELTYEERCLLNYDHPDAFDTDLMMEHIRDLRAGKSIQCPVYDFTVHNRSDKTVEIHPTKSVSYTHLTLPTILLV